MYERDQSSAVQNWSNEEHTQKVCGVNNIFDGRWDNVAMCLCFSANLEPNDPRAVALAQLDKNMMLRKAQLYEMEESLPKSNSTYLKIILGNVNVSILNKDQK